MHRTRIKICGITHPGDAAAAARAGVDAIGIVFHPPAKRNVAVVDARRIIAAVPPFVTTVGLFVDTPPGEVVRLATTLGLGAIQLHGHEPHGDVQAIAPLPVLKAIRTERATLGAVLQIWRSATDVHGLGNLVGLVMESPGSAGGSGVENDWATLRDARAGGAFDGLPPVIAAGGLRPENVGQVIREVRPWAVDVSTGVEDGPTAGRKSPELIAAFVHEVRATDAALAGRPG